MVVSAYHLQDFAVSELGEVGVDQVGVVLVFAHFYVILHLGVVDLAQCGVDVGFLVFVGVFLLFLFGALGRFLRFGLLLLVFL